jgi:hypothetical protein
MRLKVVGVILPHLRAAFPDAETRLSIIDVCQLMQTSKRRWRGRVSEQVVGGWAAEGERAEQKE